MPLAFVALVVSIDCSNSTTLLCPEAVSQLTANGSCATEGLICPYVQGGFDSTRQGSTSDCFGDFIEYACTQKKWTLTAQAAVATCSIDAKGVATSPPTTGPGTTACSLGFGRCTVAPGTVGCQTACDAGVTGYSATCVSGQFVVTPTTCTSPDLDAGAEDAATSDASTVEDAATDAGDD
jgi:hypothetical protein